MADEPNVTVYLNADQGERDLFIYSAPRAVRLTHDGLEVPQGVADSLIAQGIASTEQGQESTPSQPAVAESADAPAEPAAPEQPAAPPAPSEPTAPAGPGAWSEPASAGEPAADAPAESVVEPSSGEDPAAQV